MNSFKTSSCSVATLLFGAFACGFALSPHDALGIMNQPADTPTSSASWKEDTRWNQGKAEWALYDAERTIYGKARHYAARIYTNKQMMDPKTTTKAADWRKAGFAARVFVNASQKLEDGERVELAQEWEIAGLDSAWIAEQ